MYPRPRQIIRRARIEQRHDFIFQQVIKCLRLDEILIRPVIIRFARADYPAAVGLVAFAPPAVERADIEYAVDRGLHSACAACFHRPTRIIEPDIDALHHKAGDIDIVIFKENQTAAHIVLCGKMNDLADDFFAFADRSDAPCPRK